MRRILLSAVALATGAGAMAQSAKVTKYTTPLAATVVLSEVEDKYTAQVFNLEAPSPDGNIDKEKLREVKEKVHQLFPYKVNKASRKTTAGAAPVVSIDFIADSLTGIPPDNNMAMSKGNKAVNVLNSSIAVLDGTTGKMSYKKALGLWTASLGLNGIGHHKYDPKIIYDPVADRYICVVLSGTDATNNIVVCFSQTNDPAGAWNMYKFYGDVKGDTTWFDYPAISITKDEFFLTGNKLGYNSSWKTGFKETVVYQIDKQSGYTGATNLTYQIWDSIKHANGEYVRYLHPVQAGATIEGPAQYFMSNRNFGIQTDSVWLVKIPDNIASGNKNVEVNFLKTTTKYGAPPNGRQPDTSATLATNDARMLGAFYIDNEIHFCNTSVNASSGAAAVFHGVISDYKNNPSVTHSSIVGVDTLDFGYPNLAYAGKKNGKNQAIIGFNFTGPNTFPGLAAILYDGTQYSDIVRIKEGAGSIKMLSGKEQRWGDYTGAQVDWNNPGSVWVVGIYGKKVGTNTQYGNWMAKLTSPTHVGISEKAITTTDVKVYPNPAYQFIGFDFDVKEAGKVNFAIYDMKGQKVDQVLEMHCKKGHNLIRLNIGSLPTGNYVLKAQTATGASVMAEKFIKQ